MIIENAIKVKKRVNSKSKGSGFESSICKKLSTLLVPMEFKRSQSSGAILGGKNIKNIEKFSDEIKTIFIGDVCPSNESDVIRSEGWKFRFTVECKFYKSVDTLQQIFNNSKIYDWFNQAVTDAKKLNKQPLLIFKFNHTDIFVAVDSSTELPRDILTKIIQLDIKTKKINIVLFDELSLDKNWWKESI